MSPFFSCILGFMHHGCRQCCEPAQACNDRALTQQLPPVQSSSQLQLSVMIDGHDHEHVRSIIFVLMIMSGIIIMMRRMLQHSSYGIMWHASPCGRLHNEVSASASLQAESSRLGIKLRETIG